MIIIGFSVLYDTLSDVGSMTKLIMVIIVDDNDY